MNSSLSKAKTSAKGATTSLKLTIALQV